MEINSYIFYKLRFKIHSTIKNPIKNINGLTINVKEFMGVIL